MAGRLEGSRPWTKDAMTHLRTMRMKLHVRYLERPLDER